MRTLLEEKKRRDAQTPAWKRIEHHDHPAPRREEVPGAPQEGDHSAPPPAATRPRGNRGS